LLESDAFWVSDLNTDHVWANKVLEDKIESVCNSFGESLILENLFTPITELHHDPDAFASKLEVSFTN
jgi:hypothetical protein